MVVIPRSKKRESLIARLFAKLLVKEKEPTRRRDRFESRALQLPMGLRLRWAHLQGQVAANATVYVVAAPPQVLTQESERIMPISQQIAVVM